MSADRDRRHRARRTILEFLYARYQADPLCPVSLLDAVGAAGEAKELVVPHLRYLESAGLVRVSWNLSGTGLIRIQKDGLDVAEDPRMMDRLFPLGGEECAPAVTRAGEEIMRRIDGRTDLPLAERLYLREIAGEFYAALRRLAGLGMDYGRLHRQFADLRERLPELARELDDSLKPEGRA